MSIDLEALFAQGGDEQGTPLTWVSTHLPPTTMWVDGRTARNYEAQGFEIVDYEPPPKGWEGVYAGRAKIRKKGPGTTYVWSPELAALHVQVGRAWDEAHQGLRFGRVWKRLHEAHSWLMNEGRYHEELMRVPKGSTEAMLEVPQGRVVAAIREVAERYGGDTRRRIRRWASGVEGWRYEPPGGADGGGGP